MKSAGQGFDRGARRFVKVRINAFGRRLIGCVELSVGHQRVSDLLNAPPACLLLLPHEPLGTARDNDGAQVVFKDAITYVEAVEEPKAGAGMQAPGEFRSVVAELREREPQQLLAEIFLPAGQTLMDVVSDERPFISLRNVHFTNFVERYGFLAVGKNQLILLRT